MPDALFEKSGDRFVPTSLAAGPWAPGVLHGGPPSALLARQVELTDGSADMVVTRLTVELLRPVPMEPLRVSSRLVRPGRRVQLVEATLATDAHEVARLTALRIRRTELPLPSDLPGDGAAVPPPDAGSPIASTAWLSGFHDQAVEHRFVRGSFAEPGPATDWIRLRYPLVGGEETSPLCRVAAVADFGNGVASVLPVDRFTYVNPDLTVSLHRHPRGEWICLDAHTRVEPTGVGLAESRLFDLDGPIGRAVQCLIVDLRR
jgi:hypothetical protein